MGGIRAGGPVKPFNEPRNPLAGSVLDDNPITLNLNERPVRSWSSLSWKPLDEREREQRDRAHYRAYRILLWVMLAALLPYCVAMGRPSAWLMRESPLVVWLLLVTALSLPQSVLLWTEPDEPAAELRALEAR